MEGMPDHEKTPSERLATPVQFLKGVGPQRAELLERLGLEAVRDVLFFFPRDYEEYTGRRDIEQLEEDKLQSVRGIVEEVELRAAKTGRSVLGVLLRSGSRHLRALWFNQPFLVDQFHRGDELLVSGKPKYQGLMWVMKHPRVTQLGEAEPDPQAGILPLYHLTEGLQQWQVRKIVRAAVEEYADVLEEAFPQAFLAEHAIWPLAQALPEIHFPSSRESLQNAQRRFIYQELFILQLALAVRRQQQTVDRAEQFEATAKIDARIRRLFPFDLTPGQERAIAEIARDMAAARPMNRLLQGDVGSGKTVVALYTMLLAVAHGAQAVLMAPTEVLARQHALTLKRMLGGSRVAMAELVGSLPTSQRQKMLQGIASGEIDLVVGTQAVIQEDVEFHRLGLVVIDEQHKFGVRQRAVLRKTGADPHYLVMTATPIPRTVTMTLFGDLDVSTLADSPPGRQKVRTYLTGEDKRDRWWKFFGEQIRQGRQGYVVTPLVDPSEAIGARSVEETYEALANGPLEAFRLGLIHGRMRPDEKDAVMAAFRSGEIQVLVSTSVIEVGVDVPNATLMTIESGERFGLAQLHQLRGRISRGRFPGHCAVFTDKPAAEALHRLKAFASTTDGFRLAEIDFRLRGPGELFGTRQHGLPPFRIADLARDMVVLEEARRDALQMVEADPHLADPQHARLRRMLHARYGQVLELGDVG